VKTYIFDIVELIANRSHPALEMNAVINTHEIESAKILLQSAVNLTVSEAVASKISETKPPHVIYNGRRREEWRGLNNSKDYTHKLAYSGAFIPDCGLENVLRCLSYLPKNYNLLLAGYYAHKDYELRIKTLISSLNIEDRITFHHKPDVEKIPEILKSSQLYLIPFNPSVLNMQVSMPNRLFDAIAAGVPILGQAGLHLTQFTEDNKIGQSIDFEKSEEAARDIQTLLEGHLPPQWRDNVKDVFEQTCWEAQVKALKSIFADMPAT